MAAKPSLWVYSKGSWIMAARMFAQRKFGGTHFQFNSRPLWTSAWSIYWFTKCCRLGDLSVNAFAQDNHQCCVNNGQYKLSAENVFNHPSFKTLHASQRGKLKLCSDVKFGFVRVLHAITILPPSQLRENVKIIAFPQTMYITSQRTSITMQQISLSAHRHQLYSCQGYKKAISRYLGSDKH